MKKTLLFLLLAATFSLSAQTIEMRAVQRDSERTTYEPTVILPLNLLYRLDTAVLYGKDDAFDYYQSVIENGERVQTYQELAPIADSTSGQIWFYPENLSWSDSRFGSFRQGSFSKYTIKYIEIIDVKMDIGLRKVTRIMDGEEVQENRIVSHYVVIGHFTDGTSFQLGDKVTPCNIVANNDMHVPYPQPVPGARYLIRSSIDDNNAFGTGENFSIDGGLKIDYD